MKIIEDNVADIETDVEYDSLIKLMGEMGIKMSTDNNHTLILYNDEVNSMEYVAIALFEICELNNTDAIRIMLEAHNKGRAVAKTGSFDEINNMKIALNKRNIEATIEN